MLHLQPLLQQQSAFYDTRYERGVSEPGITQQHCCCCDDHTGNVSSSKSCAQIIMPLIGLPKHILRVCQNSCRLKRAPTTVQRRRSLMIPGKASLCLPVCYRSDLHRCSGTSAFVGGGGDSTRTFDKIINIYISIHTAVVAVVSWPSIEHEHLPLFLSCISTATACVASCTSQRKHRFLIFTVFQ